jgi:Trypsin-like peptidase domain
MTRLRHLGLGLICSLVLLVAPASAGAAVTLQPGAYHETDAGSCTLNFAYTGPAGQTLLGTAAHCVERVGQPVYDIEGVHFGNVAWIGNADTTAEDFAFIEVLPAHVARVSPAVKGYPQYPKGSTVPADTTTGDTIQLSGYGLGYDTTPFTQEKRQALFQWDDTEIYGVAGPIHWGDSGGPLVHVKTGKALGIVSRLCVGNCTEEGPTVQGILNGAAAAGFPVTLRTA